MHRTNDKATTWSYTTISAAIAVIQTDAAELMAQIAALGDKSYLGRRIASEFWAEISATRTTMEAAAYAVAGWTEDAYWREVDRRIDAKVVYSDAELAAFDAAESAYRTAHPFVV